jgi:hypothetical protein
MARSSSAVDCSKLRDSDPLISPVNFSATTRINASNTHGSNKTIRPLILGHGRAGLASVQSIGITRRYPPGTSTTNTGAPRFVWRRQTVTRCPYKGSIG